MVDILLERIQIQIKKIGWYIIRKNKNSDRKKIKYISSSLLPYALGPDWPHLFFGTVLGTPCQNPLESAQYQPEDIYNLTQNMNFHSNIWLATSYNKVKFSG